MRKFLELVLCCFTQFVALIGIFIGSTYVPELTRVIRAAINGQPWQGSELARLLACVCGPILLGLGLSFALYWYIVASSRLRQRMAAFPGQPWLWRADWEAKRIQIPHAAALGFLSMAFAMYLLAVLPLGVYMASVKNAKMIYGFLAVLAMFLLLFARLQWINRFRNRSVLHLETLPGRIAGQLSGLATIPLSFPNDTTFHVRLRCELTLTSHARPGNKDDLISVLTNTQNNKSSSESRTTTVYDDTQLVTPEETLRSPQSTSVRVAFDIPAGLPSTGTITKAAGPDSNTASTRHYTWSIRIRLSSESDLREIAFQVPVFAE